MRTLLNLVEAQARQRPGPTVTTTRGPAAGAFELAVTEGEGVKAEFAQAEDVALVLHTSGTTSKPKIVPLTHRNLACSAQSIARSLELTPQDRCLNIMP